MTTENIQLLILAILGSSVITAVLTTWAGRHKLKVDVESIEVQTAGRVVKLVSDQLDALTATGKVQAAELERLRDKVDDLERRLNESDSDRRALAMQVERLHAHIDSLEALMRAGGIEPPPRPRPYGGGGD